MSPSKWLPFALVLLLARPLAAEVPKPADDRAVDAKAKVIAGRAEVLRGVRKELGILKGVDPGRHRVTLLLDGEVLPKVWDLTPDAEIKRAGWWARLDQLTVGDRVWAWFKMNRKKEPLAILMLADELSEQDIHGPVRLTAQDRNGLTVQTAGGGSRTVKVYNPTVRRGKDKVGLDTLKQGSFLYLQSTKDQVRLILDPAAFEQIRTDQKVALRKRWTDEGLPGTVIFLHLSCELELMLDHEAIRWGRSLKPGDEVTLATTPPARAVVRLVRPWRERTQLRLVVAGDDLAELTIGQRLKLRMKPPVPEVENAPLPPDLDRPRTRDERIEWFLASIYCPCSVGGDRCTGMFYTLASCNPNGCGMPAALRKEVAALIDKGKPDKQIFDELLKKHGPDLLRPHLKP